MLNGSSRLVAAEGASVLRRGSSLSGRPPKIILGTFDFPWDNLPLRAGGNSGLMVVGVPEANMPHWQKRHQKLSATHHSQT